MKILYQIHRNSDFICSFGMARHDLKGLQHEDLRSLIWHAFTFYFFILILFDRKLPSSRSQQLGLVQAEVRTPSSSSMWMAGAQVLEPSSASPRMSINRKLYVRWSSRALHYGMQASHAELTVVSNGCPLIVF